MTIFRVRSTTWPRTLLTYPVDFSHRPCAAEQLHLTDKAGQAIPFQLSDVQKAQDGRIVFAKVSFFSSLEPGATHEFKLEIGDPATHPAGLSVNVIQDGKTRIVDSGLLKIRLPESQTISEGEEVPGPLLAINRGQGWIGVSRLNIGRMHVRRIEATVVDTGALFDVYRITYLFDGGARYEATLKSVLGYPFVDFSENMSGLDSGMGVSVEMDWTGFVPDRRYAANGWAQPHGFLGIDEPVTTPGIIEEPHWWPADRVEDPHKEMIFHLAAFEGNAPKTAVPAMSFWEASAQGQELGVFVPETKDWDDHQYMIWQPTTLLQVSSLLRRPSHLALAPRFRDTQNRHLSRCYASQRSGDAANARHIHSGRQGLSACFCREWRILAGHFAWTLCPMAALMVRLARSEPREGLGSQLPLQFAPGATAIVGWRVDSRRAISRRSSVAL